MLNLSTRSSSVRPRSRWFEKIMAAIALLNFCLVLLDYSYIPFRDDYLKLNPNLTEQYGSIFKGIEPHRMTASYLHTVDQLEKTLRETNPSPDSKSGLGGDQASGTSTADIAQLDPLVLANLRRQSRAIINENPFELANKTGTLERIKRRMSDYVSATTGTDVESSKQAFDTFWSQNYLTPATVDERLEFFDTKIRPLIATNYYRRIDVPLIGAHSVPTDRFIVLDAGFMGLFLIEFLCRTAWLSRRQTNTSWFDAMLWRWYDVFLFIPFWRWLRLIPVTFRISQSRLLNLEPLRNRLTRFIISSVAIELTEVVVLRVIDQVQNMVKSGDMRRSLLNPNPSQRYIDLNGVDEIQVISQRLMSTLLEKVVPKLQPDLETLLQHTISSVLSKNTIYQGVQTLPGMANLSHQLTQQLSTELYTVFYQVLRDTLQDEKGAELTQTLLQKLGQIFRQELQQDQGLGEVESLLTVWLDEVKINYVQRLADEDIETLRHETQKIYAITQNTST